MARRKSLLSSSRCMVLTNAAGSANTRPASAAAGAGSAGGAAGATMVMAVFFSGAAREAAGGRDHGRIAALSGERAGADCSGTGLRGVIHSIATSPRGAAGIAEIGRAHV